MESKAVRLWQSLEVRRQPTCPTRRIEYYPLLVGALSNGFAGIHVAV